MSGLNVALILTAKQLRELQQFLGREDLPPEHWQLCDELTELVNSGVDALGQAEEKEWLERLDPNAPLN